MDKAVHPAGVKASPRSLAVFAIVAGSYKQALAARPQSIDLPDRYHDSLLKRITGQILSAIEALDPGPSDARANKPRTVAGATNHRTVISRAILGGIAQAVAAHPEIRINDDRPLGKRIVGQVIAHHLRLLALDPRSKSPLGGSA